MALISIGATALAGCAVPLATEVVVLELRPSGTPTPNRTATATAAYAATLKANQTQNANYSATGRAVQSQMALTPTRTPMPTETLAPCEVGGIPTDWPLTPGKYWTYLATATENTFRIASDPPEFVLESSLQATYRITETVLATASIDNLCAARFQRVGIRESGELRYLGDRELNREWWYVFVEGKVYYQRLPTPDLSRLSGSWLDFIFPLTTGSCWWGDPGWRNNPPSPACGEVTVRAPKEVTTPAGTFENCYLVHSYPFLRVQHWQRFCPGVGIVEAGYHGTGPMTYEGGLSEVLIAYGESLP